ncbi:polysaccharide export protein [Pedobacter changchengzhani]|uniref:Polysaccharide export protein n=1 Tax=Pedobacter changchengzhani TaxID=2529274 RepID=A0A4R5MPH8_9SPHI|nr:polysaccharide biosynthesis/export family protein [Pedobacter changchengzhani]TDG37694.1 polysaccharide export protein [Pedobacter changchengzhani]
MKNHIYFLLLMLLFCSCKGYKQVAYFQDLNKDGVINQEIKNYTTLKLQKDDLLSISISSIEPKAAAVYNIGNGGGVSAVGMGSSSGQDGYLIDENGEIQIPTLGTVKVGGLTTSEAKILITKKLVPFLGNPVVNLKLINFKISILGDVGAPGVYPIQGERISFVEAISKAGDLNISGLRKNILLVRETDGARKFIRLDLNDKDIFNSPYYYLQPNDVIYVQPSNSKYAAVDNTTRNISFALSGISLLLVLFTTFK